MNELLKKAIARSQTEKVPPLWTKIDNGDGEPPIYRKALTVKDKYEFIEYKEWLKQLYLVDYDVDLENPKPNKDKSSNEPSEEEVEFSNILTSAMVLSFVSSAFYTEIDGKKVRMFSDPRWFNLTEQNREVGGEFLEFATQNGIKEAISEYYRLNKITPKKKPTKPRKKED